MSAPFEKRTLKGIQLQRLSARWSLDVNRLLMSAPFSSAFFVAFLFLLDNALVS